MTEFNQGDIIRNAAHYHIATNNVISRSSGCSKRGMIVIALESKFD
jgi:hypothetical protein